MYLSASQIKLLYPKWHPEKKVAVESACKKKWYNRYVLKLPQPSSTSTNLGSALHAVVERYLDCGDLDDPELYPDKWDEGLSTTEAEKVKTLVTMGIEEGKVLRHPKRKIEQEIKWNLFEDLDIVGFIDYWHSGNCITDWKTSSDPGKWGLNEDEGSTNYIGRDIQLLLYCLWVLEEVGIEEDHFVVEHVYFRTKKDPIVKSVKAKVPISRVKEFGKWLREEVIPEFQELKKQSAAVVRSFKSGEDACKAYGGCPYQKFCAVGGLNSEEYKKMVEMKEKLKGVKTMGLLDKVKKEEVKEEPKAEVKETPKAKPKPKPRAKTTPKKKEPEGFRLIHGANIIGNVEVTLFGAVVNQLTDFILSDLQKKDKKLAAVSSWVGLDSFKRKDILHLYKQEILEALQGKTIMVGQMTQDMKEVYCIVYPHATEIIEGHVL